MTKDDVKLRKVKTLAGIRFTKLHCDFGLSYLIRYKFFLLFFFLYRFYYIGLILGNSFVVPVRC